jgi:hypothetical protein
MGVVASVLLVLVLAVLALLLLISLGGLGVLELSLWLLGTAGGLALVAWREVRRGRRPSAP